MKFTQPFVVKTYAYLPTPKYTFRDEDTKIWDKSAKSGTNRCHE
jgi:hypothetical protein